MEPSGTSGIRAIAQTVQKLIDAEQEGVLALVVRSVGSAPGRLGAKAVIMPDGSIDGTVGGGVVEARVIADALNVLDDGRGPRTLHYKLAELGMSCGGEMSVYLEPLQPPRRVVIYGAGHVGAAVARVLKILGCRVTVVDDRPEWANRERFAEVDELLVMPFAEALEKQPPGARDHVLIVTRGHDHDQLVLESVIERPVPWVGMIGSRRKAAAAVEKLKERGVEPGQLARLHSPVGLDIGAVTPEEIAVAIAAELILLWRKGGRREEAQAKGRPVPKPAGGDERPREAGG